MKKTLTILLIILFYPQVSLAVKEDSYLHQVESCETKNKKMGNLAWKQCLNKFQFEYLFGNFSDGKGSFKIENNEVKYFRIDFFNDNYNFLITQIKDIKINITGFGEIIIDTDIIEIWPQQKSYCLTKVSGTYFADKGCVLIDVSSYGLSIDDVQTNNWSWSSGKTLGVLLIEEKKKLFDTKPFISDIEKCVKTNLKKKYREQYIRFACRFVLAKKLDTSKVKIIKTLSYDMTADSKEINTLKATLTNDISNNFVISKFALLTKYNGDKCGGTFRSFEQVDIEPGETYNLNEKVPEIGWNGKTVPCRTTKGLSLSTELDIWGFYY